MEDKVLLLDANDVKVGETFARRARQLVSKQRAVWVDDSHRSVRFTSDDDERYDTDQDLIIDASAHGDPEPEKRYAKMDSDRTDRPDKSIYELAAKRIRDRKLFIISSISFMGIISALLAPIAMEQVYFDSMSFSFGLMLGMCVMGYSIHAYTYLKPRLRNSLSKDREKRKALNLAMEVERLKKMGFED